MDLSMPDPSHLFFRRLQIFSSSVSITQDEDKNGCYSQILESSNFFSKRVIRAQVIVKWWRKYEQKQNTNSCSSIWFFQLVSPFWATPVFLLASHCPFHLHSGPQHFSQHWYRWSILASFFKLRARVHRRKIGGTECVTFVCPSHPSHLR